MTALARLRLPPHVCDRLLNHAEGAIRGVAAVYQRHDFLAERKEALEAWARHDSHVAVERFRDAFAAVTGGAGDGNRTRVLSLGS